MENYTCKVVENEKYVNEDEVININSWYNCSNSCDYVVPVPESQVLSYEVVKEDKSDDKDKYHNVSYEV